MSDLSPRVLLKMRPLGMRYEVFTKATWVRVPVQGVLQGTAILPVHRTTSGASVLPPCLDQPC